MARKKQPAQQARSWVPLFFEKACYEPGADQLMVLWAWLASLDRSAAEFADGIDEDHPLLWWSSWITHVEQAIDEGNPRAAEIGLSYVLADFRSPFGRSHKRRTLTRLRRNLSLVSQSALTPLELFVKKIDRLKYKPQEYNDLKRLIADLRASV